MTTRIRIYHSPDADDRFMFWPLREKLLKTDEFSFDFFEADTQALNETASVVMPEVCAISAIHYGRVHKIYQPMLMGASVGDGYGPVLVCPKRDVARFESNPELIDKSLLLTPGLKTTAHAILTLLGHNFKRVEVVPIAPMQLVFDRLAEIGTLDEPVVALLIHEGRLIYSNYNTALLFDVGESWTKKTGAQLPLGINAIRRDLPIEMRLELSKLFSQSCEYALNHQAEYIDLAAQSSGYYASPLSRSELVRYLGMYANSDTLCASESVKNSFKILIEMALERELFVSDSTIMFDWI